jgi:FecR-like protein
MAATIASATQSIRSLLGPAFRRTLAIAAAVLVIAVFSLLLIDKRAAAGDVSPAMRAWVVQEVKGGAFSRPHDGDDSQWQALRTGARIDAGSVVRTDASGMMELTNGKDTVRLSPSSEIELPAGRIGDPVTRVIHWIGTAFFHVGKRPGPQFEVDTPYVVAIVKGTKFTTTVSDAGASVKVSEGIVGVSATAGGSSIDVTAGGSASVSAAYPESVTPGSPSGDATPAGGRGKGSTLAHASDGPPAGTDVEAGAVSAALSGGADDDSIDGAGSSATARGGRGGNGNGHGRESEGDSVLIGNGGGQGGVDDGDDGDNGGGCHGHGSRHHHGGHHHDHDHGDRHGGHHD